MVPAGWEEKRELGGVGRGRGKKRSLASQKLPFVARQKALAGRASKVPLAHAQQREEGKKLIKTHPASGAQGPGYTDGLLRLDPDLDLSFALLCLAWLCLSWPLAHRIVPSLTKYGISIFGNRPRLGLAWHGMTWYPLFITLTLPLSRSSTLSLSLLQSTQN